MDVSNLYPTTRKDTVSSVGSSWPTKLTRKDTVSVGSSRPMELTAWGSGLLQRGGHIVGLPSSRPTVTHSVGERPTAWRSYCGATVVTANGNLQRGGATYSVAVLIGTQKPIAPARTTVWLIIYE